MIFDWPSWWAAEEVSVPSKRLRVMDQLRAWYRPLWRNGITTDIVDSADDLSGYRAVLAPSAYLLTDAALDNLRGYVAGGGTLVFGPFSGISDRQGHVRRGRFPVGLSDVFGLSGEQWLPLPDQEQVIISSELLGDGPASLWSEQLRAEGAEVIAGFVGGPVDGQPAILHNRYQQGHSWYVGTLPDDDQLGKLIMTVLERAGANPVLDQLPDGVEAVRRGEALFLLNHNRAGITVDLPGRWRDLLTGDEVAGRVGLGAEDAKVLLPLE